MKRNNFILVGLISCALMIATATPVSAAVTGLGESDIPAKYSSGYEIINCIDTSKWQGQLTADNWEDIYAYGVDAAFLRAGHTRLSTGEHSADSTFPESIKGAYDSGMEIGVYYFTMATTPEEAKAEAEFFLETIEPYREMITLPVVFDFETNHRGKLTNSMMNSIGVEGCTKICEAFCDTVKGAGYDPMIYASSSVFENNLNAKRLEQKYKIWVAAYPRGSSATKYSGQYYAWQYSSSVRIDGIKGKVDADYIFRDVKDSSNKEEQEVETVLENQYANGDSVSEESQPDQETEISKLKPEDSYLKYYDVKEIKGNSKEYNIDDVTVTVPKNTKKKKIVVNVNDVDGKVHSYIIRKNKDKYTQEENMMATILGGYFSSKDEIDPRYVSNKVEPNILMSYRKGRKLSVYGMNTIFEKLMLDSYYEDGLSTESSLDVYKQLAKGKPVILSVGNKAHLLLSMDEDGNAIEAVFDGEDRIAHVNIDKLLSQMSAKGRTKSLFYNTSQQNGYVLIDADTK